MLWRANPLRLNECGLVVFRSISGTIKVCCQRMRAGSLRKRVMRIPVVVCITSIRQNYTIFDSIHEDGYKAISRFWANLSAHVADDAADSWRFTGCQQP